MVYYIWFTSTPLVSNLNQFFNWLMLCKQVKTHFTVRGGS